jgi:D-3-phosphoglycerate dehydrogenase
MLALDNTFEIDYMPTIERGELLTIIEKYDVMIVRSRTKVDSELIEHAKNLKIVARPGTGLDNIDLEATKKRAIEVINSPEALVEAVAEHVVCLMLGLCRRLPDANQSMKLGKWEKDSFVGIEMCGKTLGVLGLGRIGRRVAEICRTFGMSILGYDVIAVPEEVLDSLKCEIVSLEELFASSDFITLHVPLTSDTEHLVDTVRLETMKTGSYLINASRGGVVDQPALILALETGKLAGAALDVFEAEPPDPGILKAPNLIMTPHIAGQTVEGQIEALSIIGSKIQEYFRLH